MSGTPVCRRKPLVLQLFDRKCCILVFRLGGRRHQASAARRCASGLRLRCSEDRTLGALAHTTASQTCEERPRHNVIRACVGSGLGLKRLGTHNDPGRARWRSTGTKAELSQIISVLACEGFPDCRAGPEMGSGSRGEELLAIRSLAAGDPAVCVALFYGSSSVHRWP
jgi:hypothetical protein